MKIRYVGDSCCEFPEDFKKEHDCVNVPLTIMVGDDVIIDDASFDQADFLKKVAAYPKCPKSSCPSPDQFLQSSCMRKIIRMRKRRSMFLILILHPAEKCRYF